MSSDQSHGIHSRQDGRLFIPLSCITWIPGLLLFAIQAGLQGQGWGWDHIRYAWAIFAGSWVWITLLALLAVALSAWVRWKLAASALLFGVFFISSALGAMVNEVLATRAGNVLSLGYVIGIIWANMLHLPSNSTLFGEMFNIRRGDEIPQYMAWLVLGGCVRGLHRSSEPAAPSERGGIVTVATERPTASRAAVDGPTAADRRVPQRQQVLRRRARRKSREPGYPAGDHEPGRAQRFGQNYPDEPGDRTHPTLLAATCACSVLRPTIRNNFSGWLDIARSSILSARVLPAVSLSNMR